MREAEDRHVRAVRERLLVGDERRHLGVREAGIERIARPPGERVRSDRDEAQLGMPEHAVERLLPRVAGGADDADICHEAHSMRNRRHLCGSEDGSPLRLCTASGMLEAQMLCLAVSAFHSDPLLAFDGRAASRGVGIELIDILPC